MFRLKNIMFSLNYTNTQHAFFVRIWQERTPNGNQGGESKMGGGASLSYIPQESKQTVAHYGLSRVPMTTGLFFGVLSSLFDVDGRRTPDSWTFTTHAAPASGNKAKDSLPAAIQVINIMLPTLYIKNVISVL